MKKVFHLNIKLEDIDFDLYFEDQDTAERTVAMLEGSLTNKAKKLLKITANVCEVYSKDTAMEQILLGFGLADAGKN